jgi:hypothetical protein
MKTALDIPVILVMLLLHLITNGMEILETRLNNLSSRLALWRLKANDALADLALDQHKEDVEYCKFLLEHRREKKFQWVNLLILLAGQQAAGEKEATDGFE